MVTYVLDKHKNPLMPCHNGALIRTLLREKKAKVVRSKPFTIQLLIEVRNKYVQSVNLGVDSGYKHIGFSATTKKKELFSAELEQDCGMVERNKKRRMYRRQRRNRLRYRAPRFNNRRKPQGWIAPSLERKKNTHLQYIGYLCSILPITTINVEIGLFDPHLLKAEMEGKTISGIEYQHGEMYQSENLKTYIRNRDNYTCQNPDCACHKMKKSEREQLKLQIHHLGYWKHDRSNRPSNLITLCELSHTPENHQPGRILYGWQPKTKSLKETAFMNLVRKEIVDSLRIIYPNKKIQTQYGYQTNITRNECYREKSHHNDAFCISGIHSKERADITYFFKQSRRNNRSLETFYDAKYIDSRDGKKKSGKELFCGRTTRNKSLNTENLHVYRSCKELKGRRSIRNRHYQYHPHDIIWYSGRRYNVKGIQNKGDYIAVEGRTPVQEKKVHIHKYAGSIYIDRMKFRF